MELWCGAGFAHGGVWRLQEARLRRREGEAPPIFGSALLPPPPGARLPNWDAATPPASLPPPPRRLTC